MALVSFDLDGVLQKNPFRFGHDDGVFARIKFALAPYAHPHDPTAGAALALAAVAEEHDARLARGLLVLAYDWDDIVATVAARLGCPDSLPVRAWVEECCRLPGLIRAYEGSAACLESLAAAGHTLVSITNGYRCYQEPVLRGLGLWDFFHTVATPDGVGYAKPEPGIFRAMEHLGTPRIHVGDTLPHDVAGAKRAGWLAIYIAQPTAPGYTPLPADVAALPPEHRPAQAGDWLAARRERERGLYPHPAVSDVEMYPDAIVQSLHEVPATVAALLSRP